MIKVFKYLHRAHKKKDNRGLFSLTTKVEKTQWLEARARQTQARHQVQALQQAQLNMGNLAKGVLAPRKL